MDPPKPTDNVDLKSFEFLDHHLKIAAKQKILLPTRSTTEQQYDDIAQLTARTKHTVEQEFKDLQLQLTIQQQIDQTKTNTTSNTLEEDLDQNVPTDTAKPPTSKTDWTLAQWADNDINNDGLTKIMNNIKKNTTIEQLRAKNCQIHLQQP